MTDKPIDPWLYQLDESLHAKAKEKSWSDKVIIKPKDKSIPFEFVTKENKKKDQT